MRDCIRLLMSGALLCGARANASLAPEHFPRDGRIGAAVAAVVHEMEPEFVAPLLSSEQVPWRFTIASPDSADWDVVFDRLRLMLHARPPVPSDRLIHYLEIGETRITDTASEFGITVGIESRCTGRGGGSTISDISTTVGVSRTGATWGWDAPGPPIIADPGICPP